MNLERFIAKRISAQEGDNKQFSKSIINIALIGIAIGLFIMILSICIITGFKKEIQSKVVGFGSHLQISNLDNNNSFETKAIYKEQIKREEILKVDGVKHIQVYANKPGIIKSKEEIQGVVLHGVGEDYDWEFFKSKLVEGNTLNINDSIKSKNIIISKKLALQLKLKLHDKVYVYFIEQQARMRRFTIKGIYNTGMEEFDNTFIYCDIKHIQKLNNWDSNMYSGCEILLNTFDNIDLKEEEIRDITSNSFSKDGSSLRVRSIKKQYPQIFNWLAMLDINVWVILSLIILVSGFNMVSGLLIIILEKTNMIGILKALGANNLSIRKIFIYQSCFLIGKGMLWGNILGLLVCLIQKYTKIIPLDPSNYYVEFVPINIDLTHILLLNLCVLIITSSMLIIPSFIITKINPSKAIKFN